MELRDRSFSFKLGGFDCLVVNDLTDPMNLPFLFPDITENQMEELLFRYKVPRGEVMNVMCLFIHTGEISLLIDTGWGIGGDGGTGELINVLDANGIKPEDIDIVINSHGHPDHIGGNTDEKGAALFPNARYFMYKEEWDFWVSIPDTEQVRNKVDKNMRTYSKKNLMPIREKFTLMDLETEIVPGIKYVSAPGHSLHHCIVDISSGTERLFYVSDLIHHPIQVPCPDFCAFGDFDPENAVKTRKRILSQAAENDILLFVCHFPFPGLGHIVKKDDAMAWVPI